MTLYLKYRPQRIDDLDSEKIRAILKKVIKSGNIPHAFLFSGPKGTGKTSTARILAKVINCEKPQKDGEPCNVCNQCTSTTNGSNIDVIELDAASNRGIDDIRALKDNIILAPASGKKKIYIIDEAHMLTTEASNAFLKTLEEPPDHVVFILATTNPEKLPETVRSRLTTVIFEKAKKEEISKKLQKVADGEKLKIKEGALDIIASTADGSFRDAIKVLEQLSISVDVINKDLVEEFISRNKVITSQEFLEILLAKDTKSAIEKIEKISQAGGSVKNFMDQLISKIHEKILDQKGVEVSDYLTLVKLLYDAKKDMYVTPIEQLPLELAIIKWSGQNLEIKKESVDNPKKEVKQVPSPLNTRESLAEKSSKKKEPEKEKAKENLPNEKLAVGDTVDNEMWVKILENVRTKNTTIEALLRAAKPIGFDGKTLTLGVYYQFHKERLEIIQNRKTLEDILCITFGKSQVRVSYQLTERQIPVVAKSVKPDLLTKADDKDIIEAAKEIFGS